MRRANDLEMILRQVDANLGALAHGHFARVWALALGLGRLALGRRTVQIRHGLKPKAKVIRAECNHPGLRHDVA